MPKSICSKPRNLVVIVFVALFMFMSAGSGLCAEKAVPFSGASVFDEEFDLSQYLGKVPIVLDFGSIYCSSCVQSIPHFIVLQGQYADKVKIVGVNLDTYGISRVKRFFDTFKSSLNFPIIIDKGLAISKQFEVATLPTYMFIDKDGNIVDTIVGFDEEKKARIDRLVKQLVEGGDVVPEEKTDEVTLMLPEQFTMTYQSKISVVGLAGNNKGPFKVKLNGGHEQLAEIKGGMFYARMQLSLGSNFIEVKYPQGSGEGTLAVVMFREPRMGEGLGVNFPLYQFHFPQKEEKCSKCHNLKPSKDMQNEKEIDEFCGKCHNYQVVDKFVHGPIATGGCIVCHDFESAPHRYELGATGSDLCFTCHEDVKGKFEKTNVHGPVATGNCVICHTPHSSSYKYQLHQTQGNLCIGCHEDMRDKIGKLRPHKPVGDEKCTACHDPHSSDSPLYFLVDQVPKLCVNCHEQKMKTHSHPMTGKPGRELPKGLVYGKDGEYVCKTCHDTHSSDEVKLFTLKGGCDACHSI